MVSSYTGQNRYFPGLVPQTYEHPEDRKALAAAKAVPGFDKAIQGIMGLGMERADYAINLGSNVRVSPRQFPRLYRLFRYAVEALDVTEPELYLINSRDINAYASGWKHPYVCIYAGTLETLSEPELLWVIAHELGHIKSAHLLYQYVGSKVLSLGVSQLSKIPMFGGLIQGIAVEGLQLALMRWSRMCEFTADRAAHLVVGDPQVGIATLMKLAGAYGLSEPINPEEFLKQSGEFAEMDGNLTSKLAMLAMGVMQIDHPFSAVRASALVEWDGSLCYQQIVHGQDQRSQSSTSVVFTENAKVIGGELREGNLKCPKCQTLHDESDMYCLTCGERVAQTYYGSSVSSFKISKNESGFHPTGYRVSTLSGGLGKVVNQNLLPQEELWYELEVNIGTGLAFTSNRVLIAKAGFLATGAFDGAKLVPFKYAEIKDFALLRAQKASSQKLVFCLDTHSHAVPSDLNAALTLSTEQLHAQHPNMTELLDEAKLKILQGFLSIFEIPRSLPQADAIQSETNPELANLVDLRLKGLISDEEFSTLKQRALQPV